LQSKYLRFLGVDLMSRFFCLKPVRADYRVQSANRLLSREFAGNCLEIHLKIFSRYKSKFGGVSLETGAAIDNRLFKASLRRRRNQSDRAKQQE
jgi:hypothetical protein